MNTQLVGFLIVPAVIAILLWILVHQSRSEQKTIKIARGLVENPAQDNGGEIVFRKPRVLGYTLIVFFVAMCCMAAYSLIHSGDSLHTTAARQKGFLAGFLVLIASSPLIRGIRDLRYTVRVSPDEVIISDRTTRSVPLRDIKDVQVKGSLCLIRMHLDLCALRVEGHRKAAES
jgi:hypothetical protein